ncbi:MAG: hypothetical protein ACUVUF_08700 [Candidatus Bathycorpusculaceae bacterium]
MNKSVVILLIGFLILGIYSYWAISDCNNQYENLTKEYNSLATTYNELVRDVFNPVQANSTAVTIVYYTNFGRNRQIITFSVSYDKYESYHKQFHPYWGEQNLTSASEYITSDDTIINQIVETIKNQTQSEEELANALLDFVQYKGFTLSIRYYTTTELKYPIETLVEMGGDCDTHSFLYATLMKAAGFKVLLLLSKNSVNGLSHAATAVHLTNSPVNSLPELEDKFFTYNGEKYYFAETTSWNYRVGDLPSWLKNAEFYVVPV